MGLEKRKVSEWWVVWKGDKHGVYISEFPVVKENIS